VSTTAPIGGPLLKASARREVALGEVIELISGQHIDVADYNADGRGVPYLTGPSDFGELNPTITRWTEYPKKTARKGDVLLTVKGSGVGKTNVLNIDEAAISRQIMAVRAKDIDARFLAFVLAGYAEHFRSLANGAAIPGISREDVTSLRVSIPPLDEQKRIVAALDQAFAALDRARANVEINLQDARQLRWQSIEDLLSDPELGELEPCGDHIELLTGFAFSSSRYTESDEDIRLVRGDNIVQGTFRWNGVKRWPASERATYQKFELARDDVLIAMDRTWVSAGIKYAVIDDAALPSLLVQRVARLRAKASIDPRYLAAWIGSPMFERYVLSIQTGLGVPHVSGGQLENFPIRVPSRDMQSRVVDRLARLSESCERLHAHYQRSTEDIATLRQSLLQAAFGQLS
jgi:type I restriction enzyme S subunit